MTLADATDPYLSEGVKPETVIVVETAAPAVFQRSAGHCHQLPSQVLTQPL